MLAVDSSTLIAFLHNAAGRDIDSFTEALLERNAVIPPVVLTEVLSNPADNQRRVYQVLTAMRELSVLEGYWQRAAQLRQAVLKQKLKCRLADALIAQSCIDHDIPLITRDTDFRHFAQWSELKLA